MKKVLVVSRHDMSSRQKADLRVNFGDVDITLYKEHVHREFVETFIQICGYYDILVLTLPENLLVRILPLLKDKVVLRSLFEGQRGNKFFAGFEQVLTFNYTSRRLRKAKKNLTIDTVKESFEDMA